MMAIHTGKPTLPPAANLPPIHGALAPGRHITSELVALCERQGMVLPPPAEVEMESEAL